MAWSAAISTAAEFLDTIDLLRELADPDLLERGASADDLLAKGRYDAAFRPALGWLLGRAAAGGVDVRTPLPRTDRAAVRAACLAIDPSYLPAFTLIDEAAALYPRVARGEVSGDRALLMKASLWVAYFDNANGYYALNNRVVAAGVAARAVGPARVLEVGAGLGSASETIEPGLVVESPLREGDRVEKGAVLARLDARRLELDLAVFEAEKKDAETVVAERTDDAERARRDLQSLRGLSERGAANPRELRDAETAASMSESRVRNAQTLVTVLDARVAVMRDRIDDRR